MCLEFRGDKGFINFFLLVEGNFVIFYLLLNRLWLKKYNWLVYGKEDILYVISFKLYFFFKLYKKGKVFKFLIINI